MSTVWARSEKTVQDLAPEKVRGRFPGIDRLRGLAIVLMMGDHLSIFLRLDAYRFTAGRVAMPLFFILSGYLLSRFTWRHAGVGAVGLALPFVASIGGQPWIDFPNVLVWYAAGAFVLTVPRLRHPLVLAGVALFGLMLAANGYAELYLHGYNPFGLVGIMALGALLRVMGPDTRLWAPADRLPAFLGLLGRFPLSWYVGHIVFLTAVISAFRTVRG